MHVFTNGLPSNRTALDVLTCVRKSLRRDHWCQHGYAVDKHGLPTGTFAKDARRRCLWGQIRYECGEQYVPGNDILAALNATARRLWGGGHYDWFRDDANGVIQVNDKLGYSGVCLLLNTTIAHLQGKVFMNDGSTAFDNSRNSTRKEKAYV